MSIFGDRVFKDVIKSSLVAQTVKNLSEMQETQVRSLGWEDPLEKKMETYPGILIWRIPNGQRSLADYSPWDCIELSTTTLSPSR